MLTRKKNYNGIARAGKVVAIHWPVSLLALLHPGLGRAHLASVVWMATIQQPNLLQTWHCCIFWMRIFEIGIFLLRIESKFYNRSVPIQETLQSPSFYNSAVFQGDNSVREAWQLVYYASAEFRAAGKLFSVARACYDWALSWWLLNLCAASHHSPEGVAKSAQAGSLEQWEDWSRLSRWMPEQWEASRSLDKE